MVLDTSLLNTQQYKVHIKGKVEQSRERSSSSPTPWCSSYWKGSLLVALDYGRQLYFLLYKYKETKRSLFGFYGIWNFVGYFMPNPFLFQAIQVSQTVLVQTIQFSISTQFSSIWPIDRALSGATTSGKGEPASDGNKGVLCIPRSSSFTGTSPSDRLESSGYDTCWKWGSYPSTEKKSVYSTAQPTGQTEVDSYQKRD